MHDHGGCEGIFSDLSSYVDGDLTGVSCEELEAHLQGCAPCRRYLQSLKATREALRAAGVEPPLSPAEVSKLLAECAQALSRARRGLG